MKSKLIWVIVFMGAFLIGTAFGCDEHRRHHSSKVPTPTVLFGG